MRNIHVEKVTEKVAELCMNAAYHLPKDMYNALKKGYESEKSPVGKGVLDQIIKNAEIADAEDRPICQDTGLTIVFLNPMVHSLYGQISTLYKPFKIHIYLIFSIHYFLLKNYYVYTQNIPL